MHRFFPLIAAVVLTVGFFGSAQPTRSQSHTPQIVTYDKLIEYLKLEVKEEKILRMVADSPTLFTLSQEQEAELKRTGASDKLIAAIKTRTSTATSDFKPGDIGAFVVILDCSGSMKDRDASGVTKWAAAQKAAIDLVQAVPDGRELAFIVYGHDVNRACMAVDAIKPLGTVDKNGRTKLVSQIQRLQPVGHTPIANSLEAAARELSNSKVMSRVILITDGMETCHGDPEKAAAALGENKLFRGLDVVGLGLNNEEAGKVGAIALKGKGKYYDAKTAKDLEKAIVDIGKVVIDRPKLDQFQTKFVDTKPSFDVSAPAPLELYNVVQGRLDNSTRTKKAHYWQIDVPAGKYKLVLEANPVGYAYKRVAIGVFFAKEDGRDGKKICDVNTTDMISRYVGYVEFNKATKATLIAANGVEMADYTLGIFPAEAPVGIPYHKYPQTVKKATVSKEFVAMIDGTDYKSRDDYYAMTLPAGDYNLSFEFTKQGGNSVYAVYIATINKDGHHEKDLVSNIESGPSTKKAVKLFLADEKDIILRLRCNGGKGSIKVLVEKVND